MSAGTPAEENKETPYFYVKSGRVKERVLRGLIEDELPKEKKLLRMPFGQGRYVPYKDRQAKWGEAITMNEIILGSMAQDDSAGHSSTLNAVHHRKKNMASRERALIMIDEARERNPGKKVFFGRSKGHPREVIGLPHISETRKGRYYGDVYEADIDEEEEDEKEIRTIFDTDPGRILGRLPLKLKADRPHPRDYPHKPLGLQTIRQSPWTTRGGGHFHG